jgi:hypothetical protein
MLDVHSRSRRHRECHKNLLGQQLSVKFDDRKWYTGTVTDVESNRLLVFYAGSNEQIWHTCASQGKKQFDGRRCFRVMGFQSLESTPPPTEVSRRLHPCHEITKHEEKFTLRELSSRLGVDLSYLMVENAALYPGRKLCAFCDPAACWWTLL